MRLTGWVLDLACVVVFVGIGRAVHTDGLSVSGLISTAWPFVTGLAIGWVARLVRHRAVTSILGGVFVCISTVAVGMTLRVLSGQGTAFAFILVALGFLGAELLGWRLLIIGIQHRRGRAESSEDPMVRAVGKTRDVRC